MAYQSNHCSAKLSSWTHALRFLFFYLLCSMCNVHWMHHSSSMYFNCCTLPPSTRLNPLNSSPHLFFVLHPYSFCATCASSIRNPSTFSFPSHYSPHRDLHFHSTLPQLHYLEHQNILSFMHVLLVSSPLLDHHCNSSASLAIKPMRPSSLGVMSRFLCLSSSRDSSSYLS